MMNDEDEEQPCEHQHMRLVPAHNERERGRRSVCKWNLYIGGWGGEKVERRELD